MNAPNLQLRAALVFVASLGVGFVDSARGQTPAVPSAVLPAPSAATVSEKAATVASDDLPALRVAVTSVNVSRNSEGRGGISLNLSIVGEGLPPTACVKRITVTKAVDNLGNVLGSSTSEESAQQMHARMASSLARVRAGGPLGAWASVDAPGRKAESLQYAEGTIELFLPSEANGSMVRIPNVLNHAGRVEGPALAKHGIVFYFFPDQASFDLAKSEVAGFEAGPPDFPKGVGFSLRDSSGRLASYELQEANGTVIRTNGTSSSAGNGNTTGTIRLLAPLPADTQLVFYLLTPEAIKTVPFRVENIALP